LEYTDSRKHTYLWMGCARPQGQGDDGLADGCAHYGARRLVVMQDVALSGVAHEGRSCGAVALAGGQLGQELHVGKV